MMFWEAPNPPLHHDRDSLGNLRHHYAAHGRHRSGKRENWEDLARVGCAWQLLARFRGVAVSFPGGAGGEGCCPRSLPMSPASASGQEGFSRGMTTQSHQELDEDGAA